MTEVFSGVWHINNQCLMSQLTQLEKLVSREFDIEISLSKMLAEPDYRQLVIDELTQLAHPEVNEIIAWLQTIEKDTAPTKPQSSNSNKKAPLLFWGVLATAIVISFLWFTGQMDTGKTTDIPSSTSNISDNRLKQPTAEIVSNKVVTQANSVANATNVTTASQDKITTTAPLPTETVFHLHGSNTIGEKLAPMLLEGFLKQRGINDFYWRNKAHLEQVLHYSQNGKNYAIELNAHGSSTAFSSLKNNTADIGMSSRRIKESEVNDLASVSGYLNKLGNEHIIGLDGLAVIVNQNNAIKQLTTEILAKIFAGEINNWDQLGGQSAPIKLYARDQHSGTWDTFKNLVLKKYNKKLSNNAERLESSSELSTLVSQNEAAIGFIGLNYVSHNKAIAIAESKTSSAIFPTRFTIGTEDYALSRRLYFYTPTSASNMIKNFAQFSLSEQGQEIVAEAGLISQNIKLEQIFPLATAPQKYQEYAKNAQRLSLNFRFDYATKDLDNKGKRDLQRLVSFMEQHQGRRIVLMGFSDSIGAKIKNTSLSLKRAKSVELALTSRGIPVFAVEAMGEALPIANNNTEAGRKRNRRVEVWLL